MDQRDAVIGQQLFDLLEEGRVVDDADMLEHADRDDAVEAPAGQLAIIDQLEFHPVGDAHRLGAALGDTRAARPRG